MKMKKARIIFFMIIIPALLLMTSCDSRSGNKVDYEITSINISPRLLYADNDTQTYSQVQVTVEDNEGYPAEGVAVQFQSDLGYIQAKVFTEDTGVATTNFQDNGKVGIAHIMASVNESEIADSIDIRENPHFEITRVTVSDPVIYADNGITSSDIEVLVKDQDGFAATGESVWFQADMGNIIAHVSTDSSGLANTTFWDDGEVGEASITAFCGTADSTITIVVAPQPPVTQLILNAGSSTINPNTVRKIEATALNQNGPVPDGTLITFETEMGYFQPSMNEFTDLENIYTAQTSNGVAKAYFNSDTQAGLNHIIARVQVGSGGGNLVESAEITIKPGNATQMTLIPRNPDTNVIQNTIAVNSGEELNIWASVTDSYGNPIAASGVVNFTTDKGNILSPVTITEMQYATLPGDTTMIQLGNAYSVFSAGVSAGVAQITAEIDSAAAATAVTVTSDQVNSIQFVDQEQVSIDVQGTGGNESAELAVNLFDMNGNLIDYPVQVWFKFLERPEGAYPEGSNINNQVFNLQDSTSTMSSNGIAVVSVNSGLTSGLIKIEAWCRTADNTKKSAAKPNIVVQAGPPAECEFTIGGYDSGEEMGAGVWRVEVSALITDLWGNPVGNGTAVYFSLPNNPDYAIIETNYAFVGNENASGDTLDGTAFTNMTYDGTFTNETVLVNVDVGPIDFEGELKLPLQSGEITMICVPAHLDWGSEYGNVGETLYTQCRINVRDGQNNQINKQRILFQTSLGMPTDDNIHPTWSEIEDGFDWVDPEVVAMWNFEYPPLNEEIPEDIHDGYTGPWDGEFGRLYKDVGFEMFECPPPVPQPPGMTTGTITATIFGTSSSVNATITLYRYEGAE